MIGPPDGEADFEVELLVCRCAAPADLATQIRSHFEFAGRRVYQATTSHPRALVTMDVAQVQAFQVKRFAVPARRRVPFRPSSAVITLLDDMHVSGITSVIPGTAGDGVVELARDARHPAISSTWIPVFNVDTFVRTGVELYVSSEADADRQLEPIAHALQLPRDDITIKPPPGWAGYGHPDLFPRTPGRR